MPISDDLFFQRCHDLAKLGDKHARPNPKVGAIIVYENKIIGEGYHEKFGSGHAEVNAVKNISLKNRNLLDKSTIYITLEPCHHFGATPPCVDLILKEKIPNIKIALPDPTEKVFHKSITKLKENNRNITVWQRTFQAMDTIEEFNAIQMMNRPFVQIKIAKSAHNYMGNETDQVHLTNDYTNTFTHKMRAYTDAILIGTNTAKIDNPSLTLRNYPGDQPIRIVLDRDEKLSKSISLLSDTHKTIVVTEKKEYQLGQNKSLILIDFNTSNFIKDLCDILLDLGIHHLMVEGGATLVNSFLKTNMWDEAVVINTKHPLKDGIKAPQIKGRLFTTKHLHDNTVHITKNDNSKSMIDLY